MNAVNMPTIDIQSYKIDFVVLDTNDPKKLILIDQSKYLDAPEKPKLFITPPGFVGHLEIPYKPNTLIILDSDSIGLTEACDYDDILVNLPDGVYQITMGICPYNELFSKKAYLKTTQLEADYNELLLNTDVSSPCIEDKKLKEQIIELDILIQSAKAEVIRGNIEKATNKYKVAANKISSLNKKLNCK
jgi:hypothetical protein